MSWNGVAPLVGLLALGATACRTNVIVLRQLDAGPDSTAPIEDAAVADDGSCPTDPPAPDASCVSRGLWCEYDGGAHGRCSARAYCSGKPSSDAVVWQLQPADPSCGPNSAACPPSFGATSDPADAACPLTIGSCDYDPGRCGCATCEQADGGHSLMQWSCRAWNDVPAFGVDGGARDGSACPPDRPPLGAACDDATLLCGYDSCGGVSLGPYLACENGRWGVGPQTDLCNSPLCR